MNLTARTPRVGRMGYLVLTLMGLLVAGCKVGPTEARRGVYCGDEDNLAPGWSYLDSQVFLYKVRADGSGYFPCEKSNTLGTTTARAVSATVQARCGAGDYFVRGLHGHVRTGSTLYRYESFTDLAHND